MVKVTLISVGILILAFWGFAISPLNTKLERKHVKNTNTTKDYITDCGFSHDYHAYEPGLVLTQFIYTTYLKLTLSKDHKTSVVQQSLVESN